MKKSNALRLTIALSVLAASLILPQAHAADKTWGGGTDGYWNTGANWGGSVPAAADNLIFSGATRQNNTNNMNGSAGITNGWIKFNPSSGGFTLNGNMLGLNSTATGVITNSAGTNILALPINVVAINKPWSIVAGSELQIAGALTNAAIANPLATLADGGTLRITSSNFQPNRFFTLINGAIILDGAFATTQDGFRLQPATGNTAVFQITNNASLAIGAGGNLRLCQTATGGSTRVDISSGTLNIAVTSGAGAGDMFVGEAASTTTVFNHNGGLVEFTGNGNNRVAFANGSASANGTYNLNGGILWTKQIVQVTAGSPGGTFNFNGGTLKPTASSTTFFQGVQAANVQSGGAIIDSTNLDITIAQNLVAGSPSGGLTKSGAGTLTLSGANTYTGNTTVSNGTLQVSTGGSLSGASAVIVKDGATFGVTNVTAGGSVLISSLTEGVSTGSGLKFNFGANALSGTIAPLQVTNLTANATVTVSVTGTTLAAGQFPLIAFTNVTGLANFQLGTVPAGVTATLVTSASSISLNISSVAKQLAWSGAASGLWDTSAINWKDLNNANNPTNYAQSGGFGDQVTFDDSLTANSAINVALAVTPVSMLVSNNTTAYSFTGSGKISGGVGLVKNGTSSLTMGTTNDYSGGTTLMAGKIRLAMDNPLGGGALSINGGSLTSDGASARVLTNSAKILANITLGDATDTGLITLSNKVDFGGSSRTLTFNSDVIFAGGATNGGISSKQGNATLTIKGAVEFSSLQDVQAGTLIYNGATVHSTDRLVVDAIANSTARLVITNGASIIVSNSVGNLRSGRGSGSATATNYVDVAGFYSLPNADAADGLITLRGDAGYSEMTFYPGGDFAARGVTNWFGVGNTVFKFNGGILRARNSTANFFEGLAQALVQSGGANIDDGGFAITINQPLLDGSGGGGLTKSGAGALTLAATNTYTGSTVVSNGTLSVITRTLATGDLVVADGATLGVINNGGTMTASSMTMGSAGTSTLLFNFPGGNAGSASINVTGALTGNGPVTINITGTGFSVGTIPLIQFGSVSGLGNFQLGSLPSGVTATLATNSTTISLNISSAPARQLVWTGAANSQWDTTSIDWTSLIGGSPAQYSQLAGIGDLVRFDDTGAPGSTAISVGLITTPTSMTVSNNSLSYSFSGSGAISGAGSLTKAGPGALTLNTVNTFTGGGAVTNGTLYVGADSALGTGSIGVGGGAMIAPTSGSFALSNAFSSVVGGNINFGVTNGSLTLQSNLVINISNVKLSVTGGSNLVVKTSLQLITNGAGLDIYGSRVIIDGAQAANTDDGIRLHSSGGMGVTELDITNNGVYVLGLVSGGPNVRLGQDAGVAGTNILRISSGLLLMTNTAQAILVGDKSSTTGMVYQAGGMVNFQTANPGGSGILFGSTSGASGEYHLDGGSLITPRVATTSGASGTLYFNGGTLVASTNTFASAFMSGTTAYVSAGGANIDDGGFNISINQSLLDGGSGGGLTKTGNGTLTLGGTNTYTGNTIISSGTLQLTGSGSIASSASIAVNSGAIFDVSGLSTAFALNSGQVLSNRTSTGVINGNASTAAGSVGLNYASGTPALAVANGTLTLSASTAFNVNNTGSALASGSYKTIATNTAGAVAGILPAVTVSGSGVAAGQHVSLGIVNGELYLVVTNHAPVVAGIVTNNVTSGLTWKLAIADLKTAAGWSDVDGDTVTLSGVSGTSFNGTNVSSDANYVYYNGLVTAEDYFAYTITDGNLTANGTVYLEAVAGTAPNISNPTTDGSGHPTFSGSGIPGYTYGVESATNLSGPWTNAGTVTSAADGSWTFTDSAQVNPPTIFYRIYYPYSAGSPPQ